ncbi:MAG: sulfotransferase family protein [Bacteroidetes bacterium]|nr:sulfotransferase family protein [Bacteroidota bacterium]
MIPFLRNKNSGIRNKFQLISVHIPKTAGTSFRGILKEVYGEEAVIRLDIGLVNEKIRINEELYDKKKVSSKVRVAHGHFSPALLHKYFDISESTPFITWLRDPIERVISNYFYLQKRLREELEEEKRGLNILSKMQRSLMEYAAQEINQNRMSKFLAGMELEDFAFVGIQDHFSEDLQRIAKLLDWEETQELKHNITGRKKEGVSDEERAQIARYNQADVELYQKALERRDRYHG